MTVGIAYVDGPRLTRSFLAAADWVAAGRDEINRINVFPVPDGDTGTNFSLTLRAVADALRALGDAPLPETARAAAERAAADSADVGEFMARLLAEAERALARTPELLAVLKEAGVVDAGGKGFVRMLEGVVRFIEGDPILPAEPDGEDAAAPAAFAAALVEVAAERDFQYCTEVLVRGAQLPAANEVRAAMHNFGGSVQVAVMADVLKVHVHTDTPEAVFSYAERWGRIETTKAEDMRAQHRRLSHGARRPVAVVADSSADLADAVLDRHHISMVPLQLMFGNETFRDRVELKPEDFYRRLRIAKDLPTTSQPTPAEFVRVFRDALGEADEVVALTLSGALSGTYQSGKAAAKAAGLERVHVVNTRTVSLGLGMLALRAAELAESGWRAADIVAELERVREQSGVFITVDRYDNLLRSGRVTRGKAWLAGMLDVKPILSLDEAGRVVPVDRVRGRDNVVPRVLSLLERRLTPRPKVVRFGVAHAEAPEAAERLRTALVAAYRPRDCFVSLATGVLGTHVGEGAWGVFYQVEDGTPTRLEHGRVSDGWRA